MGVSHCCAKALSLMGRSQERDSISCSSLHELNTYKELTASRSKMSSLKGKKKEDKYQ